ncbi:response regulator transcription factor [Xanthomonas sp.]|uniref:response regulator transcription factor n=1 Tax=Xanthomonas sp. TaxID=29446 RepID=UPI0031BA7F1E
MVDAQGKADAAAAAPDATSLAGLTVVVVEDDAEMRDIIVDELGFRGAQVHGLDSAEALYRHLSVHPCDMVVLDVGLPGENGYTVARHLRQIARVGIVMLTGRGGAGDMAHGLHQGADLYLVKPLDPAVLAAALQSLRRRLAPAATVTAAPAAATPATPAARWRLADDGWTLQSPGGASLALTESERGFLRPLFAAAGTPVDRETLIAALTDQPWDFDPHRLETLVHRLRTRVSGACGQPLPVRALRGSGYLLVAGAE